MAMDRLSRRTLLRLTGALGVGALVAPGLAACSGGSPTPQAGGGGGGGAYTPGSSALKVQLGPEITGVKYPDGYVGPKAREFEKFGDGTTEYRVLVREFADINYETNEFTNWLEEKTGVKVKYEVVPIGADGATKINAMIASGDLPDAFLAGPVWMGGFTRSQLYVYGQQGLFLGLDKLVDENAPQLLENFKNVPGLREYFTAPNGVMYAFPADNQCFHCASSGSRTFISKSWMQAVGATSHPKTLDDFEAMLVEMKGAKGEAPYTGSQDSRPVWMVYNAYLNTGTDWLVRDGDKIVFTPTTDTFREAVIRINKMTAAGLIDRNGFTQTGDQLKRLTMAAGGSKAGVVSASSQYALDNINFDNPNAPWLDFEVLTPATGPSGKAVVPWSYDVGGVVGMVLTNTAKNPDILVRWADAQVHLTGTLSMKWGVQGKGWDWATDEKGIDGRQAIYKHLDSTTKNQGSQEQGPYTLMRDVRHGEAIDATKSVEPALYDAGKLCEPFASPEAEFFTTPYFDETQANVIAEVQANVTSALNQNLAQLYTGAADPSTDAGWKTLQDALAAAGLPEYLKVLTDADKVTKR